MVEHSVKDLESLLSHKEFFQLKYNKNSIKPYVHSNDLILGPHQFFCKYYINPNNSNKRLLCKYGTGTGKSLAALVTGLQYLDLNKYNIDQASFNKIIILGFLKYAFIKEILQHPELGILDREFSNHYMYLLTNKDTDVQLQKEYITKKNILNKILKSKNIYFYGYRKLFYSIFINRKSANNIWTDNLSNFDQLYSELNTGDIELNHEVLIRFNNAFVICDEIQDLYNSKEMNYYGLALQFVFNVYESPELYTDILLKNKITIEKNPLHILYLTATTLTVKPSEVVDLINLIVPLDKLPDKKYITKSLLFTSDEKLLPNALSFIKKILYGYVSYFIEEAENYPSSEFVGTTIKEIGYLKFVKCEITNIHYKVYKTNFSSIVESININDISILDGVIPNLDNTSPPHYKNKDIISAVEDNIIEYNKQYGLTLNKNQTFSGEFLKYESIKKYSCKSKKILDIIFNNLKNNGGKIIIIHQLVKYWGCLYIQELLLYNGIIEYNDTPNEHTLCSICGIKQSEHTKESIEHFVPAKFVLVYGEMSDAQISKNIQNFRNNNIYGHSCRILIGSQIINKAYHFTEVRDLIIASMPISFSDIVQIRGRAVRKNSHILLPKKCQHVNIHILILSLPDEYSIEEKKYIEKYNYYRSIQEIDRVINESALDNYLFYDYIKDADNLVALPVTKTSLSIKELNTLFYDAFYNVDEINIITYLIKILFIKYSPIWSVDDLWKSIMDPPFYVPIDCTYISKENFTIALSDMCVLKNIQTLTIFDINKFIYKDNSYYYLSVKEDFIFLTKFTELRDETVLNLNSIYITNTVDLEPWNDFSIYKNNVFNIQNLLEIDEVFQIEQLEHEFYEKYGNVIVENMPLSLEYFNVSFHHNMIQRIILYFIDLYLNKNIKILSIMNDTQHMFKVKCLMFYTKLDLIIYADQLVDSQEYSIYSKFIFRDESLYEKFNNPYLFSSQYKKKFKDIKLVEKKYNKILDMLLPVGHFLDINNVRTKYPILYDIDRKIWKPIYNFFDSTKIQNEIENDIIIGYHVISNDSLDLKFKIRTPLHKIEKVVDFRMLERGSICFTKTKEFLKELAKTLSIDTTSNKNKELCLLIKNELIRRELDGIKQAYKNKDKSKVKWFYFIYETLPQI